MPAWSFLTNHARVLVCITHDPGVRLRDIASMVGITERSAFGIVTELAQAGYVEKERYGRRNRYRVQAISRCEKPSVQSGPSARSWICSSTPAPTRCADRAVLMTASHPVQRGRWLELPVVRASASPPRRGDRR